MLSHSTQMDKDQIINELIKRIGELEKRQAALKEENNWLKLRVKELEARCNRDSKNSSKPPSSDGYRKMPAFPRGTKGRKGGQKGHKGNNLKQVENPDEIVECLPQRCSCGHEFTANELELSERRQVFDLPQPRLIITEYQIHKAKCPVCGQVHRGKVPEEVKAPTQYGNGVKSYVVMLNTLFKLPYNKIQLLFEDMFGFPINESTIFAANKKCYDNLEESEKVIKDNLLKSAVAHADETGLRIEGRLQWLHNMSNNLYTYLFVHPNRGKKAMEGEDSILNKFSGWLVHDGWGSYFKFTHMKHAMCGAHILRDLQGVIDNEQSKWAHVFKKFLLQVYSMPFQQRQKREQQIRSRYMQICLLGEKAEPPPVKTKGRQKRTLGRNLVERLIKHQKMVLAFAFNQQVPFTNNQAERDVRPAKIKQKISNSFRSFTGAQMYARIEGFISTVRKNDRNVFYELCTTFNGNNFLTGH